jgi:DNA topoisomerase I
MIKNLVIVESPAKARTIENFLGADYLVRSSMGHVRDLPSKDIGIDIEHDFLPRYEVMSDKVKIINELKKLSKDAETVWLATDEDREGEAISWHLKETLSLADSKIKRIAFHEITKSAIEHAINNPRNINIGLVDAQQARRVLDRIVGFELSPVLWRKVKPSLSAGRVQSVAVRLIVEREKEIHEFVSKSTYKVVGEFIVEESAKKQSFKADLSEKFDTLEQAKAFLEQCKSAKFKIKSIETSPGKKSPAPPFTTSTLQQEASRKLGFSVSRTMTVAQQLYESGKITYMRTDSVNLSDMAIGAAKNEIISQFGQEYSKTRKFATKTKGAQEAHEAIRPSYINQHTIEGDASARRLYELIWKRTIASQMSDAQLERTTITVEVSTASQTFISIGEVIKFDGFLKVYLESNDDETEDNDSTLLPPVKKGDPLSLVQIIAQEKYAQHAPRYTEASLVKKLEELGIGRPSTYAPIISTIQKRDYVVREDRPGKTREVNVLTLKNEKITSEIKSENYGQEKAKMFPTDIGVVVTNFLSENFNDIMNYNFTANVEKEFDEIAEGKVQWTKMMSIFYKQFHPQVELTLKNSEKVSGERELGIDPKSGKKVVARLGRFGAMAQIGSSDDEEKPQFASLNKMQSIETITLEEALKLFELPKTIGIFEDKEVIVAVGRFGPYVKHNSAFVSIPKTIDPMDITLEQSIVLIEEKRIQAVKNAPRPLGSHNGEEVMVAVGKYGPYIKIGAKNVALPRKTDASLITLEDAIKLAEATEKKNILAEYKEDDTIKVLSGRYGAYIAVGKNNYKIPAGKTPEKLTLEECKEIIDATPSTSKTKKTTVKATTKATTKKVVKATTKKTTTKKK